MSSSSVGQVSADWGYIGSTCLGILHVSLLTQYRQVKNGTHQHSPDYYKVGNASLLPL